MVQRPNYKTRYHKSPRRKLRENILTFKTKQYFLGSAFQGKRNKSKCKQMEPNKT